MHLQISAEASIHADMINRRAGTLVHPLIGKCQTGSYGFPFFCDDSSIIVAFEGQVWEVIGNYMILKFN